jgi:hypothetical protein
VKERHPVFDAWRQYAVGDITVDGASRRIAFETFAPARPKGVARLVVDRKLASGQETNLLGGVKASLAVRIKGADRFVAPIG